MSDFKKIKVIIIVMLCLFCLFSFAACNNGDETEKEDFVLYDPNTVLSEFRSDIIGSVSQMRPILRFASKNEVERIALTGYATERISGDKSYKVTVDFAYKNFEYSKKTSGYFIYELPIVCSAEALSENPTDEKIRISNLTFDVDGRHIALKTEYDLELFSSENCIDNSSIGDSVADQTNFSTAQIKAMQDIEIVGVSFVSEGIELGERVFVNQPETPVEDFFFDLPDRLAKGEKYTFDFTAKKKSGVDCASSYFVLEYRLSGEDTIRRTPFGSMHLQYDIVKWEQSLSK